MHYLLDLLQGLGIAAAIGIRPFLPTLMAGALAACNIGLNFDGTPFAFMESPAFLLAMVVCVAISGVVERRMNGDIARTTAGLAIMLVIALVLGGLQGAASIADHSKDWYPGLAVGASGAGLAYAAARSLFTRVRARLDAE